ncbi:MAG: hypothetical protein GC134_06020 [Proteobacteria bacterium]|nr:hypothetical protein [Pseudomonadota bacterium]
MRFLLALLGVTAFTFASMFFHITSEAVNIALTAVLLGLMGFATYLGLPKDTIKAGWAASKATTIQCTLMCLMANIILSTVAVITAVVMYLAPSNQVPAAELGQMGLFVVAMAVSGGLFRLLALYLLRKRPQWLWR